MTEGAGEIHRLAVAVERLAGEMNTGVATLRGDINVLATREHSNANAITDLRKDVDALQERRFPLPHIGGLCGIAAVVLSVIQTFGKG